MFKINLKKKNRFKTDSHFPEWTMYKGYINFLTGDLIQLEDGHVYIVVESTYKGSQHLYRLQTMLLRSGASALPSQYLEAGMYYKKVGHTTT